MLGVVFRFVLKDPPELVSVSADVKALLGFTREEFLAAKVRLADRIHADDADIKASLFSPKTENPTGTFNIRLRHADGRIRCINGEFTKTPGGVNGDSILDLTFEDAQQIKEPGDATLVASFKSLIEQTTDYIYIKNRNHVILAASPLMAQLTELAKNEAELEGKTDYDIHPEEAADNYYRLDAMALAESRRVNQIQRVPAQDGTTRWIDNRKYPINGPDGEIIGIFGVAPDITEPIEMRSKLLASEESLREAQAIAGLSNYVLDIPNKQWILSPELETLLGIDAKYGRAFEAIWPLIHPDDRAVMAERFKGYFLGERTSFDSEYRIVRYTDGTVRWVHTLGRLEIDAQGKPLTLRGTVQDITERKLAESSLRESENLLQLFIEHAPAALAMLDCEMRYLAVSRRWLAIHDLTGQNLINHSHYEFFANVPEAWKDMHRRALAGEIMRSDEDCLQRPDGSEQWLRRELLPWFSGEGKIGGIIIVSEDITAKTQSEERLRLAASVFMGAREGITITDAGGTILDVNDAFTRITGYTREEVLGQNPRLLKSGLQSAEFYQKMWGSLIREGHWSGEIWNRTKSGDIYPEMLSVNAIRDAGGKTTQYVALFSDITEIKKQQQELEHMAHYDALTGLPNRVLFADRLRQAMAQAHRSKRMLAVAYFDLDGFKAINDRYGHPVGDGLLTAMAFRMKRVMREGDTLARLGGDEFAAVMLDLDDVKACSHSLNRLLAAASKEAQIGDFTLRVSASAGVTFYPQAEEVDAEVLLRQAGQAMYQAKLAGKSRYHKFDPSEDMIARSRHENLEHVRKALAAQQFVLHYQPKVNMRTGALIGAEALIRWQHPDRGLLPPGMFLPVIEDHQLAVDIGDWVIESAISQMEAWQSSGLDLPISVNVSAFELQQPDFADRLAARLAKHPAIKPSNLELEVLETSALQDVVQASQVLKACRELGVSISLDDFGTGYSSLSYLKRLPANILKIDQSFVRDMLEEPDNMTILEGVLGLAAAFRREVIAEGVETIEHGLMLLQMGCDLGQGHGIAMPMPADELQPWIATWHPDPRWADVPLVNADNRAVMYASVEHYAWLGALDACFQGKRSTPPSLNPTQCRIGAWLRAEKQSARGTFAAIQAIELLHRQIHALAEEIFLSQSEGRNSVGLARLRELYRLHDKCLTRLKTFMRPGAGKIGKDGTRSRPAPSAGAV